MSEVARVALEAHALQQARIHGHSIPGIEWDVEGYEGIGTCRRCGDGLLLYADLQGSSINGTAYEFECPGNSCAHGWRIEHAPGGGVVLRCLHCGAERTER